MRYSTEKHTELLNSKFLTCRQNFTFNVCNQFTIAITFWCTVCYL